MVSVSANAAPDLPRPLHEQVRRVRGRGVRVSVLAQPVHSRLRQSAHGNPMFLLQVQCFP